MEDDFDACIHSTAMPVDEFTGRADREILVQDTGQPQSSTMSCLAESTVVTVR